MTLVTAADHRRTVESPSQGRSDLIVHEIDGDGIVFDPLNGNTHRLNPTALEIWRLCDGNRTLSDIAELLANRYEVSVAEAAGHVHRVARVFDERELLLSRPASSTKEGSLAPVAQ